MAGTHPIGGSPAGPQIPSGCWRVPGCFVKRLVYIGLFGERGGTRTLDPMIKSHVLYHLSYALTRRGV